MGGIFRSNCRSGNGDPLKKCIGAPVSRQKAASRGDVPDFHGEVHAGVNDAERGVGQMQGAAAEGPKLVATEHGIDQRLMPVVQRSVQGDDALVPARRPERGLQRRGVEPQALPRSAVKQRPAAEVVNEAVNRLPVAQQPERDRRQRDAECVVIGPIDWIEHPGPLAPARNWRGAPPRVPR